MSSKNICIFFANCNIHFFCHLICNFYKLLNGILKTFNFVISICYFLIFNVNFMFFNYNNFSDSDSLRTCNTLVHNLTSYSPKFWLSNSTTFAIASSSSAPSHSKVTSAPFLMQAEIILIRLFALILLSPNTIVTSHANFPISFATTPAGLMCNPSGLFTVNVLLTIFISS